MSNLCQQEETGSLGEAGYHQSNLILAAPTLRASFGAGNRKPRPALMPAWGHPEQDLFPVTRCPLRDISSSAWCSQPQRWQHRMCAWVRIAPGRSTPLLVTRGHLQEDINAEGWEVIWPEDRRGAVFQAKDQFVGVATGGTELASIQGQAPPWALLCLSRCVWSSENPEREVLCCLHMEKGHTAEC